MSRNEKRSVLPRATEKRGGYTGGMPAAMVPPPPKIPSATIKAANDAAKAKSAEKS
jgi:hypothetical protein